MLEVSGSLRLRCAPLRMTGFGVGEERSYKGNNKSNGIG
jgi:hypothetical protein